MLHNNFRKEARSNNSQLNIIAVSPSETIVGLMHPARIALGAVC